MTNRGFSHIGLSTLDLDKTRDFYENVLKFKAVRCDILKVKEGGQIRHIFFDTGRDQLLAFMEARGVPDVPAHYEAGINRRLGVPGASAAAAADEPGGVHLDDQLRRRERADFDEGRGREVAGEELPARLPHLFALLDVGHVDVDADDVVHLPAGRLDEVLDLGEALLGLAVRRAVAQHPALAVAGGHARDEELVAVDATVRPGSGRGLRQLGAGHALRLHGVSLLTSPGPCGKHARSRAARARWSRAPR